MAVELDDRWGGGLGASDIWLGLLAALSFGYAGAVILGLITVGP